MADTTLPELRKGRDSARGCWSTDGLTDLAQAARQHRTTPGSYRRAARWHYLASCSAILCHQLWASLTPLPQGRHMLLPNTPEHSGAVHSSPAQEEFVPSEPATLCSFRAAFKARPWLLLLPHHVLSMLGFSSLSHSASSLCFAPPQRAGTSSGPATGLWTGPRAPRGLSLCSYSTGTTC